MKSGVLAPTLGALKHLKILVHGRQPVFVHNHPLLCRQQRQSWFHTSSFLLATKLHRLSDVGEGTKEVQVIQWFVEEGARVEEWAKLCEVQSDKASVEITSRYAGVIKKLHFEKDDIVQVGDVMVEFEVEGAEEEEDDQAESTKDETAEEEQVAEQSVPEELEKGKEEETQPPPRATQETARQPTKHGSLATPAVRGMLKQHGLLIEDIEGSGRDGRVLKEDVQRHVARQSQPPAEQVKTPSRPAPGAKQVETPQRLTPVQSAMFKTMTASLSIPHFLYSDSVDITQLSTMRQRLNINRQAQGSSKISYMPFVIKAVSMALYKFPLLNARLDTSTDPKKPQLLVRNVHNIGVAMDTPGGLIVPVIKNVNAQSINSISQELQRLSQLGQAGKLSNDDMSGGTITVSNIGSIGGEVVAPVIVEGQLAIMGMGKIKSVPVFADDGITIHKAEMMGLSWSADHRVVDGATMARMARVVQDYLEEPGSMIVDMG